MIISRILVYSVIMELYYDTVLSELREEKM